MLRFIVLCLCWLLTQPAVAVIHGKQMPIYSVSTGQLQIELFKWYGGTNSMVTEYDQCSAVVVGTRPLTLLTASHCLRDVKLNPVTRTPILEVFLGLPVPDVKSVFYSQFGEIEQNLARDLAVVVFDDDAPPGVSALPVMQSFSDTQVEVCGYGRGSDDRQLNSPSCARKPVLSADENFYRFVPQYYQFLDPQLHLQFRAQFAAKQAMVSTSSALLAMNRIDDQWYQPALPMPTKGDSGGPWIASTEKGQRGVIAITSFIETFYRKNKQWPFFKNSKLPLSDFPYAAYGVRLNTAEAKALFHRARIGGADIQMLDE